VADDRVAVHRMPGLEPVGVVTLPSPALRGMFVDTAGRLVTLTGNALDRWDAATGARLEHLDLAALGLGPGVDGLQLVPLHDPGRVALFAPDRPDVAVVDTAARRVVDSLPVGPDLAFVAFQGPHLLVFRPDETVELWNTGTRQREFGPLPGAGGYERQAGFLGPPGQFVVTDGGLGVGRTLRVYDVARPEPLAVLELGDADPIYGMSADGTTLAHRDGEYRFTGVLRLDPAVWRTQLCGVLGSRQLTADELATLPSAPDGPVCP
jgi:hypothetical protein